MSSVLPTVRTTVRPNHCSFCRQHGHNKRTCTERKREINGVREDLDVQGFFERLEANEAAAAAAAAPVVEAAPAVEDPRAALEAEWAARDAELEAGRVEREFALDANLEAMLVAYEAESARRERIIQVFQEGVRASLDACAESLNCEEALELHRLRLRELQRRCELDMEPNPAPGLAGLMAPYADL